MKLLEPMLLSLALSASSAGAQPIETADAPKAVGPYVQAVIAGDTLYLSGQLPIDPKTGELVEGGVDKQTERVLLNLRAVLAAHSMTLDNVVMANVFLTDLNDLEMMNATYARFFKVAPARATVEVKGLARGARIEVSMVAVKARAGAASK